MNARRGVRYKEIVICAAFLLLLPVSAFAQSYVPVRDQELINRFNAYVNNLFQRWDNTFGAGAPNGTTDNLRDLIAGANPGGIARGECATGDNIEGAPNPAFSYGVDTPNDPTTWGPWGFAVASSGNRLPAAIPAGAGPNRGPYVQINYSHSLRCLLMEIVEWQKLAISVQIHSLLKNYIADAQTAQLTKQLKNRVSAANYNFAKAGNVVNNNGVITSAPIFVTSYNQNLYNVNGRQIDNLADQAAGDPTTPPPQGSLGVCQPWRVDVAADMVRNNRAKGEDPYRYTDSVTRCSLTDPNSGNFAQEADVNAFFTNFNDPSTREGGAMAYMDMLYNPQNSPLGAGTQLDAIADQRIANQTKSTEAEAANSGFIPTKRCSGDPDDPRCLDDQNSLAVNPGGQNEGNITNLTAQMNNEITAPGLDAQSATSSQLSPTDINTNTGLMAADTLPLETSGTAVNELIQEFYDVIDIGYFGIRGNTTQWAQATMLSIYDEMKFNDNLQNGQGGSIVTNGQAPNPTGY